MKYLQKYTEVLDKYFSEFNHIVEITYSACCSALTQELLKSNSDEYLYTIVRSVVGDRHLILEKEDIEQQLHLIWIHLCKNYYSGQTQPNVSIKMYLKRMSVWGIRDWIIRQKTEILPISNSSYSENNEPLFSLDLKFVVKGSLLNIFDGLSLYERYILYLFYTCDKGINDISELLYKDTKTVREQRKYILMKLKRRVNKNNASKKPARISRTKYALSA